MLNRRLIDLYLRIQENSASQYWLLAAITLLAALLRFYKLGQWSLWIDEIFTINRAQIHFGDPVVFLHNLPSTLWIPLSVVFTEISLKVFGVSEWSARLAPALIGVASIPMLFFPARKWIGSGAALIVSLLLAISTWHLFWSQNARFYISLLLFYTLAGFVFFFAIERDRPVYILIFYLLFYFAVSERMIAIFILPVVLAYLAALRLFHFESPPGLRRRNILLLILPMLGLVLFDVLRFRLTGSSLFLDAVHDFGGQQIEDPARLFVNIVFNISLPVFSLAFIAGLYLLAKKSRAGLFFLLSAALPVLLLILLNPLMFTKDRFIFMTLPYWFILAAVAIKELYAQTQGLAKLLTFGVVLILIAESSGTNLLYYQVNGGNRRSWREAFEIIKGRARPGDLYVAFWPEFGPFYLGQEILPYKDIRPASVVSSGKRYWFVVDSETRLANAPLANWLQDQALLINVFYLRIPEDDSSLRIYLYDPVHRNEPFTR